MKIFCTFLVCVLLGCNISVTFGECPPKCFCQSNTIICSLVNLRLVPKNLPKDTTLLDLRYNSIRELNENSFSDLVNLDTLLISNNELTRLTKYVFKNQIKLRILQLHKNKIEFIEPGTFENLLNLEQLFIHNNNLQTISTELFPSVTRLHNVRLDNNPLKCDCETFSFGQWLLNRSQNTSIQVSGICQEPLSLRGKTLYELDDSSLRELRVCHIPRFVVEPEDVEIEKENSSVLLRCVAKGHKKPQINWKHNGKDVNFRNRKYQLLSNGLRIESVSQQETGRYECLASNNAGHIKSKGATLKIKQITNVRISVTPEIQYSRTTTEAINPREKMLGSVSPQSAISSEGDFIRIDCQVEGHDNFPVSWYKNGVHLHNIPSKINIHRNNSLLLYNLQMEDSGKYDCITTDPATFIFGSSELIVNAAPEITESFPEIQAIGAGTSIQLRCLAVGHPTPIITWFRNGISVAPTSKISFKDGGNTLVVENVVERDSGMYTCLAQNAIGSIERNTEIRVKNRGARAPRIVIKPFDIDVPQSSSIEIPCKSDGDPLPSTLWLKDNQPMEIKAPKFKLNNAVSLRIYNVNASDSGVYTCIVSNIHGNDSASGTVTIIGIFLAKNEEFIVQASNEARLEVDRAINATLNNMFTHRNISKSPEFLMKLFRYPDEYARNILKPADIYSRTLSNVRRHILSGLKLNISDDFAYEELLTPTQLELVANVSGCVPHLLVANCSDTEFHSKYATIDGTCNNLRNPMWGSSYTAFRRLLKPIYENGFNSPVGWNKDHKYYGHSRPPARLVSTSIVRTYNITADDEITHMVMQWGQFIDHDLDHALPSTTAESWEGLDCKKTCTFSEPCFPMEVPHGDSRIKDRRCMDFIRSSAVCGSGTTSVFFDGLHPREQLNQLTSYMDASQVYGFTRDRSFLLRELRSDLGLLRGGITSEYNKIYLPTAGQNEVDCRRDLSESNTGCFLAGDIRVNEQVGLLAMQTIWLREHNRVATELREVNPHWSGDTLYYEARRIVIAEMQHITYHTWLPLFVGEKGIHMLGQYKAYNPDVNPSISNVFATAALRIGHTMINPELARLDSSYKTIPQGNLSLGKAFFSPWRLVEEGGVDPLMRGFIVTPAKKKKPNQNLNDELIDKLFTVAHAVSLDLAAMNIQRSRDHGLPGYLEYRRFCNLSAPNTFDGLKSDISDTDVRNKLKSLYGHPGNVDVWVGGILEDPVDGAKFGPLFRCLLVEQFQKLRDGDRFWYENPTVFTPSQVEQLKRVTLSRVLCDNGDNLSQITENVFILPHLQTPKFVPCSTVPKVDLSKWRNCGAGCPRPRRS